MFEAVEKISTEIMKYKTDVWYQHNFGNCDIVEENLQNKQERNSNEWSDKNKKH